VLHYGGWIERVGAGTGNAWWTCEVVDTNHSHIGWCPVAGLTDGSGGTSWGYYENSYTVPAGGAYARFYAEIHGGGDSDHTSTTAYFDTATFSSTASTWQQTFSYDPFGNITKTGNSSFQPSYSTTTNQITTTGVHYDQNGNLLTDNLGITYTWTGYGNPASINSTNLIYDAFGQMVEQQTGSTYTQILYSPAGKTAIMNGQTLAKAFVYLPGGETAIYNSSGLAYYRHSDWLGSSRLTSTASRTIYSDSAYAPFGEQYAPSGTTDASFTGQNADTTSALYDFTFRELSPSQGRWISPDPAGLAAVDPTNPQSWNRYAYVTNSPLNFVDPFGLDKKFVCMPMWGVEGGSWYCFWLDTCDAGGYGGTDSQGTGQPCNDNGTGGNPGGGSGGGRPVAANNGPAPQTPSQCTTTILNAVNNQFGTSFTSGDVQGNPFENGGATNINILGTGLPAGQFNSIQPGRYPGSPLTWLIGYGSTLHVTGQTFLDPTATFTNSNIGGDTSVLFTAHIDTSFAYNPIGALIHLFRDVLHIGGPRKPC
jgi:RHS repeat-associated protein